MPPDYEETILPFSKYTQTQNGNWLILLYRDEYKIENQGNSQSATLFFGYVSAV